MKIASLALAPLINNVLLLYYIFRLPCTKRCKVFIRITLGCYKNLISRAVISPSSLVKDTYLLEQMMGIEPTLPAWEAGVLPLNYICMEIPHNFLFSYKGFTIILRRVLLVKNCFFTKNTKNINKRRWMRLELISSSPSSGCNLPLYYCTSY